jgi:hypothetical protein
MDYGFFIKNRKCCQVKNFYFHKNFLPLTKNPVQENHIMKEIKVIGVFGAGSMGGGIAQVAGKGVCDYTSGVKRNRTF